MHSQFKAVFSILMHVITQVKEFIAGGSGMACELELDSVKLFSLKYNSAPSDIDILSPATLEVVE